LGLATRRPSPLKATPHTLVDDHELKKPWKKIKILVLVGGVKIKRRKKDTVPDTVRI
jgi:hypothetical protein